MVDTWYQDVTLFQEKLLKIPPNQLLRKFHLFLVLAQNLFEGYTTHWVNLRLSIHARSSAIETPSGARTVHGKEKANLPTL